LTVAALLLVAGVDVVDARFALVDGVERVALVYDPTVRGPGHGVGRDGFQVARLDKFL
jgi:hypothetical protein